jgi:arylsulfatase A-like enzyme
MGDAMFRWDGFLYHTYFAGFIPAAALASILWCLVAVTTSLLVSVAGMILKRVCRFIGWDINAQHFLLFIIFFILSGAAAWFVKRNILHLAIKMQIALIEFACALIIAVIATWFFRSKARQWIDVIQSHITPLVWLLGFLVILSVPIVAYQVLKTDPGKIQAEGLMPSHSITEDRPNIILVTFDALTAPNMSVYGYHRPTTPFINDWAKNASVFTKAEAAGTFTALTTASLMTGKRAWTHNVYQLHSFNSINSDTESFPVILKKNGYYNMAFTPSLYSNAIVKSIGVKTFDYAPHFHEFWTNTTLHGYLTATLAKYFGGKIRLYDWVLKADFITGDLLILTNKYRNNTNMERPAEVVFNRFLEHIIENPQEPYFAWIHLHPPHFPYLPSAPYMGMINPSPELRSSLDQYNALLKVISYKDGSISLDEVQQYVDLLRDRYDEFVMYCDKQFEDFIKKLESMHELENTIIILSSDHGEIFTPTQVGHGGDPREPETNIPLIIREFGQDKQNIIHDVVAQIDISATILDLADFPVPEWIEGRSLVPLMRGQKLPDRPAFSVNIQSNSGKEIISKGTFAVWYGDYKLIHDLEKKTSQLFNLKNDPDEKSDLMDKEPSIGQQLIGFIIDNVDKANQSYIERGQQQIKRRRAAASK